MTRSVSKIFVAAAEFKVHSHTWSWIRSWKFPSCSICCSYSLFLFKHWIAAA